MRRTLLCVGLLIAIGCGTKPTESEPVRDPKPLAKNDNPPTPNGDPKSPEPKGNQPDPDADLKAAAGDLDEYVKQLKNSTPMMVAAFKKKGLTADTYKVDPRTDMFLEIVLVVDPVYLKDALTGKTKKYTKAKMVRNNPAPAKINPKTGGVTSIPVPYEWAEVEMLP